MVGCIYIVTMSTGVNIIFYLPPEHCEGCFFKAVLPRRQRGSHSVLLSTLCVPFNQYLSPISTWFSLPHHSICLLLRDCRYLGVTFEIVRGLLVNVTDLLLCTHATLEKAVKRQMGEGGGSNERDWEREIMAEREKASRQTERKRERDMVWYVRGIKYSLAWFPLVAVISSRWKEDNGR